VGLVTLVLIAVLSTTQGREASQLTTAALLSIALFLAASAAMAFLVAGGVTSIPAAMAVWALVRPSVFLLYLALSLTGAFIAGLAFNLV
jgi:uncharacterized protein